MLRNHTDETTAIKTKQNSNKKNVLPQFYSCDVLEKAKLGKPGKNNWPGTEEREETRNPEVAEQSFECVRSSFQDNEVMDTRRFAAASVKAHGSAREKPMCAQ